MHLNMLVKCLCISGSLLLCGNRRLAAQEVSLQTDTISLTRSQLDERFVAQNLQLLAKHYQVQADSALIKQAKLWENPNINTDQNVYSNNGFFRHGGTDPAGNPIGQYFVQVEQLIRTAGKRGKQIKLAQTNANITQWEFYDLMRNLKYQLHIDFYTVVQLQSNARLYSRQMIQLGKLISGMEAQYKLGNVALKDLLRVQALKVNTELEVAENARKLSDVQTELRNLLVVPDNSYIQPLVDDNTLGNLPQDNMESLVGRAKETNSTYQLQQLQLLYSKQDLSYQKALAVPDVSLAPNFDRASNYVTNYVGLGINFALPIFNRNQGNIKAAGFRIKEEQATLQQTEVELRNKVSNAYRKLVLTTNVSTADQKDFYNKYTQLYNNVVESYNNRQISLLEFIDYFNDYEDVRERQLVQELNIRLAKEELNYQVGANVIQ